MKRDKKAVGSRGRGGGSCALHCPMAGDANEYKSTYHEGARQFVGELNFLWIEIFLGNVELGVERLCTAINEYVMLRYIAQMEKQTI